MTTDKSNTSVFRETPHRLLELTELPVTGRSVLVDPCLMVSDNLDFSLPLSLFSFSKGEPVRLGVPFKIRFTMTLLCLEGSMRIKINMVEHTVTKGDLFVAVEGMIGQCEEMSSDLKIIMIAFADSFPSETNLKMMSLVAERLQSQPLIRVSADDMADMVAIYKMMRRKIDDPEFPWKREVAVSALQTIYCYACGYWMPSGHAEKRKLTRKQQIFEDFIKLVGEYATCERSLQFYAGKLCLTPKYLSQVVLETGGRPARQWICDRVVLEAKALLKGEHLTIQQISERLNFPNQSFFGVFFKKATGYSPRVYRDEV